MKAQAGKNSGGRSTAKGRPSATAAKKPASVSRPSSKGSAVGGTTSYKNSGNANRKLGYGGEKYPTQKQVKKKGK